MNIPSYLVSGLVWISIIWPTVLHAQWEQTSGPGGGFITSMAVAESTEGLTTVFVVNGNRLYASSDHGVHWELADPGFPIQGSRYLCAKREMVFAWMSSNFWYITNTGKDWRQVAEGREYGAVYASAFSNYENGYIFLVTHETGVYRSSDNGEHWEAVNDGLEDLQPTSVATAPDTSHYVFAGTAEGIYYSPSDGDSWIKLNGLNVATRDPIVTLIPDPSAVGRARVCVGDFGVLHMSTDLGSKWTSTNVGSAMNILRSVILASNGGLASSGGRDTLLLNSSEGVFRSIDDGVSWHLASDGIQKPDITYIFRSGRRVFAATKIGCYVSTDRGSSWTESSAGMHNDLASIGSLTVLPAKAGFPEVLLAGSTDICISRTSDYGDTWDHSNNGFTSSHAMSLYATEIAVPPHPLLLFVGSWDQGVFRSQDRGHSWQNTNTGMGHRQVQTILLKPRNDNQGEYLFAGLSGETAFVSSNYGDNWRDLGYMAPVRNTRAFAFLGDTLYAGANDLLWSINDGDSWTEASPPGDHSILSLATVRDEGLSYIFAGSLGGGVAVSTNGGATWQNNNEGLTGKDVFALLIGKEHGGMQVYAATQQGSVCLSHDLGETWKDISEGLTAPVLSLAIAGPYLFAGTRYSGVWRRLLSEVSGIKEDQEASPSKIALGPNYPNPFHSQTDVKFHIPARAFVSLSIYNVVGKNVANLVSTTLGPGSHVSRWDATGLPNGRYLCRLTVNNTVLTKKLTLIK